MAPTPATPPPNRWPYGILAAFGVFIAGTAALIVVSLNHGMELVRPDYYEQELRHQDQIDREARARPLEREVRISHDPRTRQVLVQLPALHAGQQPTGEVQLYRPAAAGEDRRFALAVDATGHQACDAGELKPGLWRARLRWTVAGEEYSIDRKLVIERQTAD